MQKLDQLTVFSDNHRIDKETGKLKIGPDYACVYVPELADTILPNREVHGYSLVASSAGEVHYTGTIVGISVYDTSRQSRTTFRCKPAESPEG